MDLQQKAMRCMRRAVANARENGDDEIVDGNRQELLDDMLEYDADIEALNTEDGMTRGELLAVLNKVLDNG